MTSIYHGSCDISLTLNLELHREVQMMTQSAEDIEVLMSLKLLCREKVLDYGVVRQELHGSHGC